VLEATYLLGGDLRVSATASDPDGLQSVSITTPLGNGQANLTNGTWSATLHVTPRLGTFTGNVTARDMWGGDTTVPFQFTIAGARETLFERVVTTEIGAFADESQTALPGVLNATLEICTGGCGDGNTHLGVFVAASLSSATSSGNSTNLTTPLGRCVSTGADRVCAFDAPHGTYMDVAWAQAHFQTVTVRVTGIRV